MHAGRQRVCATAFFLLCALTGSCLIAADDEADADAVDPLYRSDSRLVQDILKSLDQSNFRDVNFGLMLVTLLYTFSRTECPCPQRARQQ